MKIFGMVACPLLVAAFLYAYAPQARVESNAQSAEAVRNFVQAFYSWYVPEALKTHETPTWNVALKDKRSAFSPILFRVLKGDSDAQAKASGEIVGLDFDPFLNTQDPCDRYEVGTVTSQEAGFRVDIYGVCSGKRNEKPDVVAELAPRDGSWVFVNFRYPRIDKDLLSTLRTLRAERQKSSR